MPEATDAAAAAARRAASAASDRRRSRRSGSGRGTWSSMDARRAMRARLASTSRTRVSSEVVGEWEEEDVVNVTLDAGASASRGLDRAFAASRDASRARRAGDRAFAAESPRRGDLLADVTASAAARIWRAGGGGGERRVGGSGDGSRGRGGWLAETPRRDERLWGASAGNATGTPVAGSHPLVVGQVRVADLRVERGGGSRAVLLILRAVRGRGRERQSRGGDVTGGHRIDNARFASVSWRSARARRGVPAHLREHRRHIPRVDGDDRASAWRVRLEAPCAAVCAPTDRDGPRPPRSPEESR